MSRRAARVALAAACCLASAAASRASLAYCPSYSPSSAFNDHDCAIEAVEGDDPSVDEWNEIFALVSQGPAVWGDAGPSVGDIGQGCGKPEPLQSVPARFPCELLKGIARQESGWRQFCAPDTPDDQIGKSSRTIISFDCGYGIGQVTSGMHGGEAPDFDRQRVAGDPTYNLATGTRILAEKWSYTECVGDNQPTVIEHWYSATWAYNGLAYVNNPNNPNYDPNRGVWNPDVGGAAPYQEKVFGWMEFPGGMWEPVELAYPNPGDIGGSGSPGELPDPSCASPTDCASTREVHVTACTSAPGGAGGAGGGSSTAENTSAGVGGTGGQAELSADADLEGSCDCRLAAGRDGGADPRGLAAVGVVLVLAAGRRRAGRGRARALQV